MASRYTTRSMSNKSSRMASRYTTRSMSNKSYHPLLQYDNNTGRRQTKPSNIRTTQFPMTVHTTSHSVSHSPSCSQPSTTSQKLHLFNDSQFPPISTPVRNSTSSPISTENSSFSTTPISTTHSSLVTSSVHNRMSYLAAVKNISSSLLPSLSTQLMTQDFWNA